MCVCVCGEIRKGMAAMAISRLLEAGQVCNKHTHHAISTPDTIVLNSLHASLPPFRPSPPSVCVCVCVCVVRVGVAVSTFFCLQQMPCNRFPLKFLRPAFGTLI